MPRIITSDFRQRMQVVATEAARRWPYREYICTYCGATFKSRSHHAPLICQSKECQRAYFRDKLRAWRKRRKTVDARRFRAGDLAR